MGSERLGKALAPEAQQGCFQQRPVFGFGITAMPRYPLLERIDDTWAQVSDDETGHDAT